MYNDLTIVIPTKNEEDCIQSTIEELTKLSFKNILIIDANSKDNTINIAERLGCKIINQSGQGYGLAIVQSLKSVDTKYVCFFDADGSYNPKSLIHMYKELVENNYDFVFCSRYQNGLKSEDDTFIRYIGNFFFTKCLSILFSLNITDFLFHYAMSTKEKYESLNLEYKSFSLCCEVPIKANLKGYKFLEIASKERKRVGGISKVNAFKDGFIILLDMLRLFIKRNDFKQK